MVGEGAEAFGAVAVVLEEAGGKDAASGEAVFGCEFVEGGEGYAVSAIEVAEGFKELGFHLVISAVLMRGFWLLGSGLRGRFGACSFMNSHHWPPLKASVG